MFPGTVLAFSVPVPLMFIRVMVLMPSVPVAMTNITIAYGPTGVNALARHVGHQVVVLLPFLQSFSSSL
jgi:hypothetical protein